jgi:hypothetical protein
MQPYADTNRVFINSEGFFEVILVGKQTGVDFKDLYEKAKPLIDKVSAEGKPLRGLIDMTKQTNYSLSSDKAALELLESIDYDKLAMYSAPHAAVTEGIIMAMGKGDYTKLFKTRDEAIAWLKAPK